MVDSHGFNEDRPGSITTFTGRVIEPLNPDPRDIDIIDIAHALARLCRYNGHVSGFLSVARHSIWVAQYVYDGTQNRRLMLSGLLHDAAEAYLSDLPKPVKHSPEMQVFRDFDDRMDEAVMARFDLPYPVPKVVTDADRKVLRHIEMPEGVGARYTWMSTPRDDEREFLSLFDDLTKGAFAEKKEEGWA